MQKITFYSIITNLPAVMPLWFSCIVLLLAGCSMNEVLVHDYIELSENSYTFDVSGNERLTISVRANAGWDLSYESDWLFVENRTETAVTLYADANTDMNLRSCEVLFVSGEAVEAATFRQEGLAPTVAKFTLYDGFQSGIVASPNGKCLVGVSYISDATATYYTAVRIFTDTGKQDILANKVTESITPRAVSDNGIFVCSDVSGVSYYYDAAGNSTRPNLPDGYLYPTIYDISADGSVMVGFARNASFQYMPVKWVNGVFEVLPIPEKDVFGEEDVPAGTMFYARGCSADGSVIYGGNSSAYTAIYWKDGQVDWVGKNRAEKKTVTVLFWGMTREIEVIEQAKIRTTGACVSPNGKYIVGYFEIYDTTVTPSVATAYPFVFNTESGAVKLITEFPNNSTTGGDALAVSDEGLVSYTTYDIQVNGAITMRFNSDGFVYDTNTDISLTTSDYLKQAIGLTLAKKDTYINCFCLSNNFFFGTNKETTALGYTYPGWTITW